MSNDSDMELTVAPAAFGLPAFEPRSLESLLLCIFNDVNPTIHRTPYLYASTSGCVPTLLVDRTSYDANQTAQYLLQKTNINEWLSAQQKNDAHVYAQYIHQALLPVLVRNWFEDDLNFDRVIKPLLRKDLPLMQRVMLPKVVRQQWLQQCVSLSVQSTSNLSQLHIIQACRTVFQSIQTKLGEKTYMLGERVCSLDATVAAYLLIIHHMPLPQNPIRALLRNEFPELVEYVCRISADYLHSPEVEPDEKYYDVVAVAKILDKKKDEDAKRAEAAANPGRTRLIKSLIFAGFGLAAVFISYRARKSSASSSKSS